MTLYPSNLSLRDFHLGEWKGKLLYQPPLFFSWVNNLSFFNFLPTNLVPFFSEEYHMYTSRQHISLISVQKFLYLICRYALSLMQYGHYLWPPFQITTIEYVYLYFS